MAAIVSVGGSIIVGPSPDPTPLVAAARVLVDVSRTEIDVNYFTSDSTTSAFGWAQGMAGVGKVDSWTVALPLDDASVVEVAGIPLGSKITLYIKKGTMSKYDVISGTIVRGLRKVIDPQTGEVIRYDFTGEFGTLTVNQNSPSVP